jgi:2-C-methyl-D-erythritol 2,4-cyclodiphosphate synthase
MKSCLAEVTSISEEAISIKATTSEHLGFVGREEGIAAHCVALIYKPEGISGYCLANDPVK